MRVRWGIPIVLSITALLVYGLAEERVVGKELASWAFAFCLLLILFLIWWVPFRRFARENRNKG
jgi:hypothetical protein